MFRLLGGIGEFASKLTFTVIMASNAISCREACYQVIACIVIKTVDTRVGTEQSPPASMACRFGRSDIHTTAPNYVSAGVLLDYPSTILRHKHIYLQLNLTE
jgi:hypothetical protein